MIALLGLILGAIIGSFLAVVLIRWPEGASAVGGRSRCDHCQHPLRPRDMVPIASFLLLKGRCRDCGGTIARTHVAMEAGAALVGAVAFAAHPLPAAFLTALFGWWLLLLAAFDLEHFWLPDRLTWPLLAAGLAAAAWLPAGPPLTDRVIGSLLGFLSLWAIALAYRALRRREGLGGGDPKIFAATGAWLGWVQLPFVLVGAGLIGLAGLALMRLRGGAVAADDRLPLGTLLALAAWPIWLLHAL
jgi:leader peptidase (prepilin peptidase)/N-methyltransferase